VGCQMARSRWAMSGEFSTGSLELDALLEELRAGDNVVFYTPNEADYLPFVASLVSYVTLSSQQLVYVRSAGELDALVAKITQMQVLDLAHFLTGASALDAIRDEVNRIGPRVYYLFESLATLSPWFATENVRRDFFLTLCPLLYQQESIAYWSLCKGQYRPATIAAITDCTQIFLNIERSEDHLVLTPLKVWGRYSEPMFRPHRVMVDDGVLHVHPLPSSFGDQQAYTDALAEKNRELTEIRNALHRSNQELKERNRELAELNQRLSEQSRLYQSLRINLDHLLALLRAGQDISSSLAVEQVRRAIVSAALRLFDTGRGDTICRLMLLEDEEKGPLEITQGSTPGWDVQFDQPALAELRQQVCRMQQTSSLTIHSSDANLQGTVAMAPIIVRRDCLGTLEVYTPDTRLDHSEAVTLLSYLASEAGIALDNAHLHREVELQGRQLRFFVENVITTEEQESRRLAFDLHDGLAQMIVASYQHFQTAQAWRQRDPGLEEREIDQGVQLLRRAIYEARRLMSQLRPAGLDDFGLVQALRLYVAQLATDADWHVSLAVDPAWQPLPVALEAALFRIVQEATTNARKYAEAPRVEIQLQAGSEQLCLSIRDWGKGFNPAQVASVPQQGLHMGLIGIRERARLWGGTCVIKSQPGKGTSIEVCIPRSRLQQAREDSARD